jgi:hypothetical protein
VTLLIFPIYWGVDTVPTGKYFSMYGGIVFLPSLAITTLLELLEHEDGVITSVRKVEK